MLNPRFCCLTRGIDHSKPKLHLRREKMTKAVTNSAPVCHTFIQVPHSALPAISQAATKSFQSRSHTSTTTVTSPRSPTILFPEAVPPRHLHQPTMQRWQVEKSYEQPYHDIAYVILSEQKADGKRIQAKLELELDGEGLSETGVWGSVH